MKLNYKRTLLVGFAFFLICTFWQAYDTIIPKILTDKFGLSQSVSGAVMAIDNLLALFLLPWFGSISDRTKTRFGKRKPFVLIGTVVACVALICLSFADNMQLASLSKISADTPASLEVLYDAEPAIEINLGDSATKTPLNEIMTREEYIALFDTKESAPELYKANYTSYVVPARQVYAARVTAESPAPLACFAGILLILLVAMGTFRSPAVALMPDVTPKPLRSKANAIINLMGAVGGILVLVLGIVFGTGKTENLLMDYTTFFGVVAAIMIAALAVFMIFVKEPEWSAEALEASEPRDEENETNNGGDRKLSKDEKLSLALILASVVLWFMGYNAVTSKYSVYAGRVLALDYNMTLTIAQAAAIISYIPIGIIASKVGRKKSILAGVLILGTVFALAGFMRAGSSLLVMNILFALAGVGWATIGVNSYPMVVELSKGSNVGKYTGFYYTASMSAQMLTPILSGIFLDISFTTLFPYAAIFVFGSFVTMLFVKHGDSKPIPKSSVEALGGAED